jgi:hypothetical protein
MSKLSRYRQQTNGFVRGNHFNLGIFDFKGATPANNDFKLLDQIVSTGRGMTLSTVMTTFCTSMSLPATVTTPTQVNIQEGLPKLSIAGTKIYTPWTVEFRGDEVLMLRSMFVKWHELITNTKNHSYGLPSLYKSNTAYACVLSPTDVPVHCYSFKGLWPSEIGGLTVGAANNDIMTFSVTFSYDYFTLNEIGGFGLAMAHEVNESFQNAGGLFGGGLNSAIKTGLDKTVHAPLGTTTTVPF